MVQLKFALVMLAFALAGCAAGPDGTDRARARAPDTGTIPRGAEKKLTLPDARAYALHGNPHPSTRQSVTAQGGGASTAYVHMSDGTATAEYRFDSQTITVTPDAVVSYHDHGSLDHTASEITEGMAHGGS